MNDLIIGLAISMCFNFIMVGFNSFLLFFILLRFKEWLNNERKKEVSKKSITIN